RQAESDPLVLAEINDEAITADDLQASLERQGRGTESLQAAEAALSLLVERRAMSQRAIAAGLDRDPVVLEQIESILISRLNEAQLHPRIAAIEISSEEVQAYYDTHRDSELAQPAQRRLAMLWFNTRGQAPLAARYRLRLEKARAELVENSDAYPIQSGFGPLAQKHSEHRASRFKGGDLGWLRPATQGGLLAEVERAGTALENPGDLSEIMESKHGIFVVRLVESRAASIKSLESVAHQIRNKLRGQRQKEIEKQFRRETREGAEITIHHERLRKLKDSPALGSETSALFSTNAQDADQSDRNHLTTNR
ncbi:MAG: peptidylprolyl isomerase, partial [Verrucomicrobiales bacterium]